MRARDIDVRQKIVARALEPRKKKLQQAFLNFIIRKRKLEKKIDLDK